MQKYKFQKNLIVWKLSRSSLFQSSHPVVSEELNSVETSVLTTFSTSAISVSEELNSVETEERADEMVAHAMFQKNLIVWKRRRRRR